MADEDTTAKKIEVLEHADTTSAEAQVEATAEESPAVAPEPPVEEKIESPKEATATDGASGESGSDPVNELTPPPAPEEAEVSQEPQEEVTEPTQEAPAQPSAATEEPVPTTEVPAASEEALEETPHPLSSGGESPTSVAQSPEGVHVQPEPAGDAETDPKAHETQRDGTSLAAQDAPVEAAMVAGVSASQAAKHPHRNNKKFAALVTVIIGALLSGLAVYLYVSTTGNTEESTQTPTNQTTNTTNEAPQEPATPATAQDVDTTTQDVDDALNELDDALDLSEDTLSDESLGL